MKHEDLEKKISNIIREAEISDIDDFTTAYAALTANATFLIECVNTASGMPRKSVDAYSESYMTGITTLCVLATPALHIKDPMSSVVNGMLPILAMAMNRVRDSLGPQVTIDVMSALLVGPLVTLTFDDHPKLEDNAWQMEVSEFMREGIHNLLAQAKEKFGFDPEWN